MKCLIIGAGSIGLRHGRILSDLGLDVQYFTKRKDLNLKISNNFEESLDLCDYILVCNETSKHHETLLKINRIINNKVILIENPLFHRCIPEAISNNKCYIGYNLRYHPVIVDCKNNIKSNKITYLELRVGSYLPNWNPERDYRQTYSAKEKLGGGVLKDISHEIDLLYYFCGRKKLTDFFSCYKKISNLEIETKDYFHSSGSLGNIVFNITLDYISKKPFRDVKIYTDNISYYADLIANTLAVHSDNSFFETKFNIDYDSTYMKMHQDILYNNGLNACEFELGKEVTKWFEIQ